MASPPTAATRSDVRSSDQESPTPARVRRKPVPGKGHRKSRGGCFNCKKRRVKCSEEAPRCSQCGRMGLECIFPAPRIAPEVPLPSPWTSTALRTTPMALRLEDLRFFHHFLVSAYPWVPFGGGHVWQEVATLAHEVGPTPVIGCPGS